MKNLILLLFLLISSSLAFSQTAEEFYEMSQAKAQQGDYQYASVLIDKAIKLDDSDIWFWLMKSEIQLELEDSYLALDYIKMAISIDTLEPEPFNRAGSFFESSGIIDSSIYMYNKAISLAKNDTMLSSYILNRGSAKAAGRDFEGALLDYQIVLKMFPNNYGALNNIAPVYRQLGMTEKAIESLEKAISIDSINEGPFINLGFAYSKIDSLETAIMYFNKALVLAPEQPLVFSNRGYVFYKMKDYANALSDINRSIELYPTNAYAYRNLALVYIDLEMMKEACTALDYALYYGFTQRYGEEVEELFIKYCEE